MAVYHRRIKASKAWGDKKCYICGSYFKEGDEIVLIVPPISIKNEYKRLALNAVLHWDEWEEILNKFGTTDDGIMNALRYLGKVKQRKTSMTESEKADIERRKQAFKQAAMTMGFYESANNKTTITVKIRKSSDRVVYNALTDKMNYKNDRQKSGMFDGLFIHEIVVTMRNKMNELLGIDERDNFTAVGAIESIRKGVNDLLG